jgi:hypothetical protein
MVAIGIDTRRHAAEVYGSSDGRQWVLREDYEALMRKATLTPMEVTSAYYLAAIAQQLLDGPHLLNDEESARVTAYLAAFREFMSRLVE